MFFYLDALAAAGFESEAPPTDGDFKDNMKEIIVPRLAELLDVVIPRIQERYYSVPAKPAE